MELVIIFLVVGFVSSFAATYAIAHRLGCRIADTRLSGSLAFLSFAGSLRLTAFTCHVLPRQDDITEPVRWLLMLPYIIAISGAVGLGWGFLSGLLAMRTKKLCVVYMIQSVPKCAQMSVKDRSLVKIEALNAAMNELAKSERKRITTEEVDRP